MRITPTRCPCLPEHPINRLLIWFLLTPVFVWLCFCSIERSQGRCRQALWGITKGRYLWYLLCCSSRPRPLASLQRSRWASAEAGSRAAQWDLQGAPESWEGIIAILTNEHTRHSYAFCISLVVHSTQLCLLMLFPCQGHACQIRHI